MKLVVYRAYKSGAKMGQLIKTEWLAGSVQKDDLFNEAWALIDDPRDSIEVVKAWDERWQQFHPATFRKGWSFDGTHKLAEGEIDARNKRT